MLEFGETYMGVVSSWRDKYLENWRPGLSRKWKNMYKITMAQMAIQWQKNKERLNGVRKKKLCEVGNCDWLVWEEQSVE